MANSVRLPIPSAFAGTAGARHLSVGHAGALVATIRGRDSLSNSVFLVVESASGAVIVGAADLSSCLTHAKVAVSVELFTDLNPSPIVSAALVGSLNGRPVGTIDAGVLGTFVGGFPNGSDSSNSASLGLLAH